MSKRVQQEIQAFLRASLDERLAQCTEKQRGVFALCYPRGVPCKDLETAIDLCDRTLAKAAPCVKCDGSGQNP